MPAPAPTPGRVIHMTGEQIRSWRTALRLTQSDLALLAGTTTPTVSNWERGKRTAPGYATRGVMPLVEFLESQELLDEYLTTTKRAERSE